MNSRSVCIAFRNKTPTDRHDRTSYQITFRKKESRRRENADPQRNPN